MKKRVVLLAALFFAVAANANLESGKTHYREMCKSCHGLATNGAFLSTQDGWGKFFDKNAAALRQKHAKSNPELFASVQFLSKSKELYEFLKEFASDSGNAAVCGCDSGE